VVRPVCYALLIALVAALTATDVQMNPVQAHELIVRVPVPGPPGQPPGTAPRSVNHWHQCEAEEVGRRPHPDMVELEFLKYRHLKKISADNKLLYRAILQAWIDTHGGGNVTYESEPTTDHNCHGVTFDNGEDSWINDIGPYLANCTKYTPPPPPPVETVVVYKHAGKIIHSGRVIQTPPDKSGVWVHSQWGPAGNFNHEVNTIPQGEEFEFEHPPGNKRKTKQGPYGTPTFYTCP